MCVCNHRKQIQFLLVFASKTWCTTQPVNIILINSTKHLNKRLVVPQLEGSENAMYINWDWNNPAKMAKPYITELGELKQSCKLIG